MVDLSGQLRCWITHNHTHIQDNVLFFIFGTLCSYDPLWRGFFFLGKPRKKRLASLARLIITPSILHRQKIIGSLGKEHQQAIEQAVVSYIPYCRARNTRFWMSWLGLNYLLFGFGEATLHILYKAYCTYSRSSVSFRRRMDESANASVFSRLPVMNAPPDAVMLYLLSRQARDFPGCVQRGMNNNNKNGLRLIIFFLDSGGRNSMKKRDISVFFWSIVRSDYYGSP